MKRIDIVGIILGVIGFGFAGFFIVKNNMFGEYTPINIFIGIIILAIGFVVMSLLHTLFHEIGHLIGGKIGGYAFYSFRIGFITIEKVNGKIKISIKKQNKYAGACQMTPPKNYTNKAFKRLIMGGINGSIIYTVISLILFILPIFSTVNNHISLFTITSFPISVFILFNNMAVFNKNNAMSDGAYLYAIKHETKEGKAMMALNQYQSMLVGGLRAKDVPQEIIDSFPVLPDDDPQAAAIYSNIYTYYLDLENVEKILYYSKKQEEALEYTIDIYKNEIIKNIIIANAIYGDMEKAINYYEKIKEDIESGEKTEDYIIKAIINRENKIAFEKEIEKAKESVKNEEIVAGKLLYEQLIIKLEKKY